MVSINPSLAIVAMPSRTQMTNNVGESVKACFDGDDAFARICFRHGVSSSHYNGSHGHDDGIDIRLMPAPVYFVSAQLCATG